jgi:hypothetical protein
MTASSHLEGSGLIGSTRAAESIVLVSLEYLGLRADKTARAETFRLFRDLKMVSRALAAAAVGDQLVRDLLAFREAAQASALDSADVNENVLSASVRLDEAKALLGVEPLNDAYCHVMSFRRTSSGARENATPH